MIFEVTDDQIKTLTDADLRTLVGFLCEEELRAQGHSPAVVTRGGHQNATDGGIDVRVSLPEGALLSGYVPAPATGFQVKAQDMPRQDILDEMSPDGVLRESIAELAAKRGAYIIVSSQGSLADTALTDRRNAMLAALDGTVPPGSLTVDFYDRHRLASWVNQHPGLVPWVRERVARPLSGWRPFGDWSSSPASLSAPYLLDDAVRLVSPSFRATEGLGVGDGVSALRALLNVPKGVVRLVGLSGVGKTRLVQALFDTKLGADALSSSQAVYTDISDTPDPVPLELVSHLISLQRRAIVIVDNCGIELHRKLAARIKAAECQVSLITIEYDISDDEPENTDVFKLEPASVSLVEQILEERFPALAHPSRRVIAEFSDGNARIAFALAQTARAGESLANLRDTELFERLFNQSKGPNQNLLDAAKVCALLYSFDGETTEGPDSELERLAGLAGMGVDQLYAHVAELSRRQLVQKRSKWRAILPHAVAHRLAKLALDDVPFARIEAALVNGGSQRMLRSFSKRIGYLHDDPRAAALVAKWFGEGGLLEPIGQLNELGKAILTNVAPVDPAATLAFIERAASRHVWFFAAENDNRSLIVRILRSIAYDPALFDRCAALLKSFALAEAPTSRDSTADVLKSLFHIRLSGTHASPAQRAHFIRGLLESNGDAESNLGVLLLDAMLECWHFSSHYAFEFGARSRDFGSIPQNREEIAEWFGQVIGVATAIGLSERAIAPEVRRVLASNLAGLCRRARIIDEVATVADQFAAKTGWPEGWIGIRSAMRRGDGEYTDSELTKLRAIAERLRPASLADMIRTYAFSKAWGALDISDVEEEEQPDRTNARERIFLLCVELGEQLAQDAAQLGGLLREIFTTEAHNTFALGRGVAAASPSISDCWSPLVETFLSVPEPRRRPTFLHGFLHGTQLRAPREADDLLDRALADPRLHAYFVNFQIFVGTDGLAFDRLMSALDFETVPLGSYQSLAGGRAHEGLSDEQVRELSRKILTKTGGVAVVTMLVGMRIFGARSEKKAIGETLKAAGRDLLEHLDFGAQAQEPDHLLGEVVSASLDAPEHEEMARSLCVKIVESVKAYQLRSWNIGDLITALMEVSPIAALDTFVEGGEPDEDFDPRFLFRDIRENKACPLHVIAENVWTDWANQKPEPRFSRLAAVVKFADADDDEAGTVWSPTAEKIIDAAPAPTDVLNVFLSRFSPMSWSGSRADIMASRVRLMETLLIHKRPDVVRWAEENLPRFKLLVENERGHEAQRDRGRDERFE